MTEPDNRIPVAKSQQMAPLPSNTDSLPANAAEIRANVNLIQTIMSEVMQDGTHYGKIPGCGDNPTLLKAGAEKIMATFRLSAEPFIEDLSGPDEVRYRITMRMYAPSGVFVGSGIGECSSNEEKYKWKGTYIKEEFDETPEDRRRKKWSSWQGNTSQKMQIRTNIADVSNTVLKMAKKRALVDAVLTVTAASDIFTQDIEDIPEDMLVGVNGQAEDPAYITETQVADLEAIIDEVGANKEGFLKVCKIDSLEHLPADKFDGAVKRLRERGSK